MLLDFYQKRKLKGLLHSKFMLVFLVGLCIPLSLSVYERYTVEREMAARREAIEAEKAELLSRKENLEERVQYLGDDRGIEAEIRRHFDVAKEGEQVVIILDDETEEATSATVVEEPKRPWYQFWD